MSMASHLSRARVLALAIVTTLALAAPMAASAGSAPAASDESAQSGQSDSQTTAGPGGRNPVIFTTKEELDLLRDRVESREEPFYRAWLLTTEEADAALDKTYVPEHSDHHGEYFNLARVHARDVRNLALLFHVTGERAYADKGVEILRLWAEDALASPYPSRGSRHSAGLVIGRVMPIFADGYAMLYQQIPAETRAKVEAWFQKMVAPIKESRHIWHTADEIVIYGVRHEYEPPWLGQQEFNNHLSAQNLGLLAIGYATGDHRLITEAERHPHNPRNLRTLMEGVILMEGDELYHGDPTLTVGAPAAQDGEIYDRYRARNGDGLQYSYLALRLLTLQADIIKNNHPSGEGHDWFAWTAPGGENLELPFEFYSEFYVTGDPSARGGYYTDSRLARPEYFAMPLYEIAAREYPDNTEIREVLETQDRVHYDDETFGWTLVLTDGMSGID